MCTSTCVSYSDDIPAQLGKQLHRYVVIILMISVNTMVTRWYHKFDVFTARFHVSICSVPIHTKAYTN